MDIDPLAREALEANISINRLQPGVIHFRKGSVTLSFYVYLEKNQFYGSEMFIPDPWIGFFRPRSRIRIKEFKCSNPKKLFLSSRKYDPGYSSRIRILIFLSIPDPGVKKAPDPGSG